MRRKGLKEIKKKEKDGAEPEPKDNPKKRPLDSDVDNEYDRNETPAPPPPRDKVDQKLKKSHKSLLVDLEGLIPSHCHQIPSQGHLKKKSRNLESPQGNIGANGKVVSPSRTRQARDVRDSPTKHPEHSRRHIPPSPHEVADDSLENNVKDGARLAWRELFLVGEKPAPNAQRDNMVISSNWLIDLYKRGGVLFPCMNPNKDPKCEGMGKLDVMGVAGTTGKYPRTTCPRCKQVTEHTPKYSNIPTNSDVPVHVMKALLQVILGDITQKKFAEVVLAYGLKAPSPEYFNHVLNIIFKEFKPLLEQILIDNRKKVYEYYLRRCGQQPVDGRMHICVSGDGCYTRRSFSSIYASRYCIVFLIEVKTGTVIDFTIIEKCMDKICRAKKYFTLNKCEHGKFHGESKSLEVSAVLELFKASEEVGFPFRYTTYVGDGDANVHNHIQSYKPAFYENKYPIVKEECVFHYRKRAKKNLTSLFKDIRVSVLTEKAKADHKKNNGNVPINYENLEAKDFKRLNPWDNMRRSILFAMQT